MYQIEKRLKVTTFRQEIKLKVGYHNWQPFRTEIMVVHTGHYLYLVTYDAEGITGAFLYKGLNDLDMIVRHVRREAQLGLDADIAVWEKKYGPTQW